MRYPTLEQVEKADREQLGSWYRFLPSPGMNHLEKHRDEYIKLLVKETEIMKKICERFTISGGFDSDLSKKIGW